MYSIIKLKLNILARLILKKYKPVIIAITGSMGKTTTKKAIYQVLHDKLDVRMSPKNYNNELGLPLTIIGSESVGSNIFLWLSIFLQAAGLILFKHKDYPKVLILEMGADRPGDLAYLTRIASPNISVVTAVGPSHLEYFSDLDSIRKEKETIVKNLDNKGLAVLNYDNEGTRLILKNCQTRVLSYGFQEGAKLRAQDLTFNSEERDKLFGLHFKLNYNGSVVPVFMNKVLSEVAVYAALAAIAVGLYFDFSLLEMIDSLQSFTLPAGRMNLIPGIKHTFIIDDSYNSNPQAVISALHTLDHIKRKDKINKYVVLGDMLELGNYSSSAHQLVGKEVAKSKIDYLLVIGERAQDIIQGAKSSGLSDNKIFYFDKINKVEQFLQKRIKAGDIILVKGSQGMRMEKIVKEIMSEPEKADSILVRQSSRWLDK